MKETTKTLVFVAVALVLTGAAVLRIPDRTGKDIAYDDQGKPFFPDFKDPFSCTDLEVVDYEPSTATAARFPGDVQGRQVGHPVALRLSGRRQGPTGQDGPAASWI